MGSLRTGFALVIAMLLLAFIALLLASIGIQVGVEIAKERVELDRFRAKQQALYALAEALGTVQSHLGPDQRISARAEILGHEVEQRLWTGVWTVGAASPPLWLVSSPTGHTLDPVDGVASTLSPVRLARVGEEDVWVPLVSDSGTGNAYAWWVGDEGVKASVAPYFQHVDTVEGLGLQVLQQVLPPLSVMPPESRHLPSAQKSALRSKMISGGSLEWAGDPWSRREGYTPLALGVLADTAEGGLRVNLATENETQGNVPIGLKDAFLQRLNESQQIVPQGVSDALIEAKQEGQIIHAPRPVVTQAGIYIGGFRYPSPDQNKLKVHMTIRVNLWNPYAASMAGWSEESERGDLYLQLDHLPPVHLFWETGSGSASGHLSFVPANLDWRYSEGPELKSAALNALPLSYRQLEPGEVRTLAIRLTADLNTTIEDRTPHRYTDDYYHLVVPAASLDLSLRGADGNRVVEFQGASFTSADTSHYQDRRLVAVGPASHPSYSEYSLIYHWFLNPDALLGEIHESEVGTDVRHWSFGLEDADEPGGHEESLYLVSRDPGLAAMDFVVFPGRPDFFYGGNGSFARNYVCLFDFAVHPPVSLCHARHLYRYGRRPEVVVTNSDTELNGWLDRWFYAEEDAPNAHLLLGDDHSKPSAASRLLMGAFNLNSTSVTAWESILSGRAYNDWKYRVQQESPRVAERVERWVARFQHTAQFSYQLPIERWPDYPQVSAEKVDQWYRLEREPDWINAWAAGVRLLTQAQVHQLASSIVDELRLRGVPFTSIGALLDDGLLQRAIDRTTINVAADLPYTEASIQQRIPRSAPAFLSQMDLLQHLGGAGAARSDTFLLRCYGVVYHPWSGQVAAQAWCEATIQRLPETIPGYPEATVRRFVITHFRWLSEEEV